MNQNLTLINFVLDRSGSMEHVRDDTIGGVNRYFDAQREQPGECWVTLAQFDDQYELLYNCVPIRQVAPRTRANYEPRNWTALYDAIGRTIDEVGESLAKRPERERPARVLLVTMTDGHENASRRYTAPMLRQKIEHQRDVYKWEFVFLGANQDAILSAKDLGIGPAAAMSYAANHVGTMQVMDSLVRHTNNYRATGQSVCFTAQEKLAQFNVGALGDAANDPIFNQDQPPQDPSNTAASAP